MNPSDNYILVEDSRNLNDDGQGDTSSAQSENSEDSAKTLAAQGIFIESEGVKPEGGVRQLENFTQELLSEGGIEIVPTDDTDII